MADENNTPDIEQQARRLRGLFRGRLGSNEEAIRVIQEVGSLEEAVDFLLREDPAEVQRFLNKTPDYLTSIRNDSDIVFQRLTNGIESEPRQFSCVTCKRAWWHRVPIEKPVSKCKKCEIKFDPVPKEHEWGIGLFECDCLNEFRSFAIMNRTVSKCYHCQREVEPTRILPKKKNIVRKIGTPPHNCNGENCYNCNNLPPPANRPRTPSVPHNNQSPPGQDQDPPRSSGLRDGQYEPDFRRHLVAINDSLDNLDLNEAEQEDNEVSNATASMDSGAAAVSPFAIDPRGQQEDGFIPVTNYRRARRAQNMSSFVRNHHSNVVSSPSVRNNVLDYYASHPPPKPVVCIHPRSVKLPRNVSRIHYASPRHISTGSTVSTHISQGSIFSKTCSIADSYATVL